MDEFHSGLDKIISVPVVPKVRTTLCLWSDLLGFGNIFFENQWELNEGSVLAISERLRKAHSEFLLHTSAMSEENLVLNDALIKTSILSLENHPDHIGFFIRGCIDSHLGVNRVEKANGHPGTRSVLSSGDSIQYFADEVRLDDYVYNYSKKDANEISDIAKRLSNPVVVYNPKHLQMNTAFSKSYILDSLGSRSGLKGNYFYIDESVLEYSKRLAEKHGIVPLVETKDGVLAFILPKVEDHVYYGFELDQEISISHKGWNTMVYRVVSFFPPDSAMSDFKYELA